MTQYPPRYITTELQVSGSTLRRWSDVFARHLSPSATTAPRRYTEHDVAVMRRIAALSDSGMRIAEIDLLLDQAEPQPLTEPTTTALQTFTTLTDALHAQQVTQSQIATTLAGLADVAELRAELASLRERVVRLEGAAHTHSGLVRGKPL